MFHTGIFHEEDATGASRAAISGGEDERRGERRRRVLKGGRVRYHNGLIARDAIVRDIAGGGVRVRIADAHLLPARFDFQFNAEPVAKPVRLAWRHGEEAGLAFA